MTADTIQKFMDAFLELPHINKTDKTINKKMKKDILNGFHNHEQMSSSILQSSFSSTLARQRSYTIERAMNSRWRKFEVKAMRKSSQEVPLGITVNIIFVEDHTEDEDSTEEIFRVLKNDIIDNNYDCFI